MHDHILMTVYAAILFFVLTPNVLLRLPPKASTLVVAAVHALVFAVIFHFTKKPLSHLLYGFGSHRAGGCKHKKTN
jgi:hypothetical protein